MTQLCPTVATPHLENRSDPAPGAFLLAGDAPRPPGLAEGWPRRAVGEAACAAEQWVVTLDTDIDTYVCHCPPLVGLARHGQGFTLLSCPLSLSLSLSLSLFTVHFGCINLIYGSYIFFLPIFSSSNIAIMSK